MGRDWRDYLTQGNGSRIDGSRFFEGLMVVTDDMVVFVSEMTKDRMFDDAELLLIQQGLRALRRCSIRGDFGIFKLGDEELRRIQEINRKIQMVYLGSDKE